MSMFPHTVTLYNVSNEELPPTFEPVLTNYITVLRGVLLDESKASNVSKSRSYPLSSRTLSGQHTAFFRPLHRP